MKEQPIPLVLAIVLLAGCTGESVNTPDGKMEPIPNVPGEIHVEDFSAITGVDPYTAYGDFAVELFRQSSTEGENTLLSPLFAAMALGMTANGATGETLDEFAALFGMDADILNALRA